MAFSWYWRYWNRVGSPSHPPQQFVFLPDPRGHFRPWHGSYEGEIMFIEQNTSVRTYVGITVYDGSCIP